MLPEEKSESDLFLQIEKIVKGNGLLLESIFLEDEEESSTKKRSKRDIEEGVEEEGSGEAKAKELKIKLTVSEAGYLAFKSLIASLENNLRIIDINDIKYDPADESAELSLKAYYWPKAI